MFFYNNLSILGQHLVYLSKKTGLSNLFCVGGCVRDILLGFSTKEDLTDIDLTCAGDPNEIWQKILEKNKTDSKDDFSLFRTEKYGTITLISKSNNTKYELTPFRTETTYTDKRRPDEIIWSNSLVADAKRRDFTVNCLYYTVVEVGENKMKQEEMGENKRKHKKTGIVESSLLGKTHDVLGQVVENIGFSYLPTDNICVITDPDIIENCRPDGHFASVVFFSYLSSYCEVNQLQIPTGLLGVVADPFGGIADIQQGIIRTVGDADARFAEDALRIIRAVRFISVRNWKLKRRLKDDVSLLGREFGNYTGNLEIPSSADLQNKEIAKQMGSSIPQKTPQFPKKFLNSPKTTPISLQIPPSLYFDFHKDTRSSLKKNFHLIRSLPKERINIELMKVLTKGSLFVFLSLCDELNLLKDLFPAVYATKGVWQPVRYHPFDTYVHTQLCVYHMDHMSSHPLARMAVLYHDVGKPDQFYLYSLGLDKEESNRVGLNHRDTSGQIARRDLERLGFSSKQIDEIVRYIDHHHKPEEILNAKSENQLKKLRTLYAEVGEERLRVLFDVCRADRLGQYNPIQPTAQSVGEMDFLDALLDELVATEGQFTMKQLAINGTRLMETFKLAPGPLLGDLLRKTFERVMDDIAGRNTVGEITKFVKGLLGNVKCGGEPCTFSE